MKYALGPRTQALLILALVATLGALVGILGDRYIAQRRAADTPPAVERTGPLRIGPAPGMRYGAALAVRLDLSAEQREQIERILEEDRVRARELAAQFQPQFRMLAEQTRERVEAVLTPAQIEQLRTIREDRMRRRGEMRSRGMGDTPPPRRRRPARPDTQPPTDSMPQP
ncbi:MAG TPA: hypothetical protein VHG09_10635 [Longimicrobiales bacterium]|nr:hypothetical protein [Longimicrobiales bacterium]